MIPRGYRPRRSDSGLLVVMERIPPPELPTLWLPKPTPEPEPFSYFEHFARTFVFTIGPIRIEDSSRYAELLGERDACGRLYADTLRPESYDRSGEVRAIDLPRFDETLDEIRSLPETPA